MELYDVMRTTFACRDFTDDPVSDETLYGIFENARFAPSGGNRQGNKVIVVRDPATKAELSRLAEPGAKRYIAQVKAGESPWNSVHPTSVTPEIAAATPPPAVLTKPFIKAPVVLVFIVDLGLVASLDKELDRVGVISGGSVYPFVWNVLLGARQAGLGGTITTLAVAQEPELKRLLGIPAEFAVAAVMPLGRPVKQLTKLKRNPVEDIVAMERFGGVPLKAG
ncbi:MAG: nitroreductase family protein [Pseudomonadota bacterium]|nr:nitroreductase family protein [Pseudomonadota bacterium]